LQSEDFVYLGGVLSHDLSCDKDVSRRIGLAAGIVRSLHKVWEAKDIKSTKVLLYWTLVQSIILYILETWTMKEEQKRKLRVFEMTVLRQICGVTWKDRRRNVDILKELSIERDIISVIQCRQLAYFGHVTRMDKDRDCCIYYGIGATIPGTLISKLRFADDISLLADSSVGLQQLLDKVHTMTHGSQGKERPKKRRIDNIREDCMNIGLSIQEASYIATDRDMWRNTVWKMDCQSARTLSCSM